MATLKRLWERLSDELEERMSRFQAAAERFADVDVNIPVPPGWLS